MSEGFYCKVTRKPEPEPCRHPKCATARELYPNGIHNLVLHCVVCQNPVPAKRAIGHYKETCSAACGSVFKEWKKYVVASRFCPNCYHPNTPEQRADFQAWRNERGYLYKRNKENRAGSHLLVLPDLEYTMTTLEKLSKDPQFIEELTSRGYKFDLDAFASFRKLVDTRKRNAVTLATSGEPAPTGENEHVTLGPS